MEPPSAAPAAPALFSPPVTLLNRPTGAAAAAAEAPVGRFSKVTGGLKSAGAAGAALGGSIPLLSGFCNYLRALVVQIGRASLPAGTMGVHSCTRAFWV